MLVTELELEPGAKDETEIIRDVKRCVTTGNRTRARSQEWDVCKINRVTSENAWQPLLRGNFATRSAKKAWSWLVAVQGSAARFQVLSTACSCSELRCRHTILVACQDSQVRRTFASGASSRVKMGRSSGNVFVELNGRVGARTPVLFARSCHFTGCQLIKKCAGRG